MRRLLAIATLLAACALPPPQPAAIAQPRCPEPTAPVPEDETGPVVAEAVSPAAELEVASELAGGIDTSGATAEIDGCAIRIVPLEGSPGPVLHVLVEVTCGAGRPTGSFERATDLELCDDLTPRVERVASYPDITLVDAGIVCQAGEAILTMTAIHNVFAIDDNGEGPPTLRILHQGRSATTYRHEGLAVESDRLEYYIEADELAVYRHRVAWCDEESMRTALGYVACTKRRRTLRPVTRVPLWPKTKGRAKDRRP